MESPEQIRIEKKRAYNRERIKTHRKEITPEKKAEYNANYYHKCRAKLEKLKEIEQLIKK